MAYAKVVAEEIADVRIRTLDLVDQLKSALEDLERVVQRTENGRNRAPETPASDAQERGDNV